MKHLHEFYAKLYTSDEQVEFTYQNVNGPKLTAESVEKMEGEITMYELTKALKGMNRNKAPGCSGLPMEIFVVFWNLISDPLLAAIYYAYNVTGCEVPLRYRTAVDCTRDLET